MDIKKENHNWDHTIEPKSSLFRFNVKEVWRYRDLLTLLLRRDFVSIYKQTILGPLWFFIQPIMSTIVFTIIFGKVANLSTDGIPKPLFYLSGIVLWNFFSEAMVKSSETFVSFSNIFSKVYFPRLIAPLSIVISSSFKFFVQFLLLIFLYGYYYIFKGGLGNINFIFLLFPVLILILALLSLGFGLIISSLTTKYRDLRFLIQYGVQLLMYVSPIVYPLSIAPEKFKIFLIINPMTGIIETFRYSLFSVGEFQPALLFYSLIISVVVFFAGVFTFNKVERNFIDVI